MFSKLAVAELLLGLTLPMAAQPSVQPAAGDERPPTGTISGLVVQTGSEEPLEGVQIQFFGPNTVRAFAISNAEGKFTVDVPPGGYQATAHRPIAGGYSGEPVIKAANVRVDQVSNMRFPFPRTAELSGRILDSRGDPVLGARVTLLMPSYEVWSTDIVYIHTPFSVQTNDLGEYFVEGIPADIAFRVYAEIANPNTAEDIATNAADPDLRRPILAGTFYPRTMDAAAAQPVRLSEGEAREGVDIQMMQTKSYCIEDTLLPVPPGDVPYTIDLDLKSVVSGLFNGSGSFRVGRVVELDEEGRARVCGLWPDNYRFTIQPKNRVAQSDMSQPQYYGGGEFSITDSDLTSINANIGPTFDWEGEIAIDGATPTAVAGESVSVGFGNITPTSLNMLVPAEIPGKFTLKNVHYDRELLRFFGMPEGWYVKSAMWDNNDLMENGRRFHLDKTGAPLRIVMSPNGSRIRVRVVNDDGEPVAGERVNLVPGDLSNARQLTARLFNCYSDENGECTVFTLPNETPRAVMPPGEYIVMAADIPINQSVEVMERIWTTLLSDGAKVTLSPGALVEATIEPVTLR